VIHLQYGLLLLLLFSEGCISSGPSSLEQQRIRDNAEAVHHDWDRISVGSKLQAIEVQFKWSGSRNVRFSIDERANVLCDKLREPTYTAFSGVSTSVVNRSYSDCRLIDLTAEERQSLRTIWSDTLRAILLSDSFDADPGLLEQAIQEGNLCVYYVLVGRYNAAETGRVDGTKVLATDSRGVVVAKLRKMKVLLYPYQFMDEVTGSSRYLF
jgi:hypothetical protein